MRIVGIIALLTGIASLAGGVVSRILVEPLMFFPGTLEAQSLLDFANTCFLLSIASMLLDSKCGS